MDLLDHLAGGDELLALEVPAPLRGELVLEVQSGHAGGLVRADGARDVDRIAVAVVGVGDERDADRVGQAARLVDHLGEGQQPDVGLSQKRGRRAEARHVHGVEARLLDQPRGERVVRAGRDHGLESGQQLPQPSRAAVVLLEHAADCIRVSFRRSLWRAKRAAIAARRPNRAPRHCSSML
jgi:hypothetical protein